MFFGSFQVLQPVDKQAYKLDLLTKKKIYNVFHVLEKNITRKGRVNKLLELELKQKLDIENDKEYKVKAIDNSKIYVKEATSQLSKLYHLVV